MKRSALLVAAGVAGFGVGGALVARMIHLIAYAAGSTIGEKGADLTTFVSVMFGFFLGAVGVAAALESDWGKK